MTDLTGPTRWGWAGRPTGATVDVETSTRFEEWFQAPFGRDLRVFIVVITLFNLGFWATDATVFADVPGAADALAEGRALNLAAAIVAFVAAWRAPRRATTIATLAGAAVCFSTAVTFGRIGGPSTAWFHFIYPFVLAPIGWYMPPARRAVVTAVYGLAVLGGYFGVRPEYLHDPMAASTVAHFAYILILGVSIGLYIDRERVRAWTLGRALEEERERLAQRVAEQTDDLRRLARRLDEVQEAERKHLARELHDELGQTLGALRLSLRVATSRFERDPAGLRPHLAQLGALLDDLTEQTRRILHALRPAIVEDLGLPAAVESLAEQLQRHGGPPCAVEVPAGRVDVPPAVASVAYRCVQEALTNVAKHATARSARVCVRVAEGELFAEVEDDGVGLTDRPTRGLGLLGMRERVAAVGGRVVIDAGVGRGTRVRVFLPLREAA